MLHYSVGWYNGDMSSELASNDMTIANAADTNSKGYST